MEPKFSTDFLDAPLNVLKNNGTLVHILKAEVTDFALIADNSLGSAVPTYGDIYEGLVVDGFGGREVVMNDIIEADVVASGKASHFAITDGVAKVHMCQELFGEQDLIGGNKFNLTACTIRVDYPVDPVV